MIRTHNRPLPPWVLWAGVLVSGGLTTLLFCYFDWPRHIVLMLLGGKIERPNLEFYPFKVWDLVWFFVLFVAFYLVAVGMYTIVTRWNLLQDAEPDGGKRRSAIGFVCLPFCLSVGCRRI